MFVESGDAAGRDVLARLHTDVAALSGLALDTCTDDDVLALWSDLETIRRKLAAVDHKVISQVQSRNLATERGARSTTVLARELLRIGIGEARARVCAAEALGPRRSLTGEALEPIYPTVAAASANGEIGPAAAAVIVDTIEKLPDPIRAVEDRAVEASLCDQAKALHPDHLRLVARRVTALLDPDGILAGEAYRDRCRAFTIHPRPDGSARLVGEATVELAEWLRTVCDCLGAPRPAADGTRDTRTAAQRNHDALLEALKAAARAEQLPAHAGITTTILLTTTERTLTTGDGLATTGHGALISGRKARSWIDGGTKLLPVALNPTGGIADFGRSRRFFSETQRLAMIARDKGCSIPGCDAPPQYTEAHHIKPWAEGGTTGIDDGALLCGYHHDHIDNWECVVIDHVPHWIAAWDPERRPIRNTAHDPAAVLEPRNKTDWDLASR